MKTSDFHYELPDELIARYPCDQRDGSRLLVLEGATGQLSDARFTDLAQFLNPGDLLVFNNTRVIPGRLFGCKQTGGQIEILIERVTGERAALAHVRASKSPKPGARLYLSAEAGADPDKASYQCTMQAREGDLFQLVFDQPVAEVLQAIGHMPLPPYIDRKDELLDKERYQTVYARKPGAVAAPTAGLHFTHSLLDGLRSKGVETAFVTLHVGAGTFQPVRVSDIRDHQMHSEWIEVGQDVVDAVQRTRARGGRVIAVGTTAVRSLESASQSGELLSFSGDSQIFIYPGYQFRSVDMMITNFHLPESTLIMLVSAFAGRENVLAAYQHAVVEGYRFFSYGDAMLVSPRTGAVNE